MRVAISHPKRRDVAVVDLVQSGIAFLLLCLNLGDVCFMRTPLFVHDRRIPSSQTHVCPPEHKVTVDYQSCGLTLGPGLPDEYRAAIRKGRRFVGAGAREIRCSGLVVRVTRQSRRLSSAARLNTLRALPMKDSVGTARRYQRGLQSALPPKRSKAARNSAGR